MKPKPVAASHEDRLNEVLAAYLQAVEAGQTPDHRALLARHPDLADDLNAFFANQDCLKRLAEPLQTSGSALLTKTQNHIPANDAGSTSEESVPVLGNFGNYEIIQEIARGGMGVVYRARHIQLNRVVALKKILPGGRTDTTDRRRFRMEAEAAATLDHPNIVPIYDVGEYENQPYFTMKVIDGGGLNGRVKEFVKDNRAAARLVATVSRAVHHAHQHGILHRDLKPANILLDAQGEPHVTDFGLAKRLTDPSGDRAKPNMTRMGTVVGTASYMAPEQALARNEALTTSADVYSLGAILFELLTGRPPFRADTFFDTLLQVVEQPPPRPRDLNRRVDPDLELICLKCLSKEPAKRYASAAALAEELENWRAGEPTSVRPMGRWERFRKRCRRHPVVTCLCACLLLCIAVVAVGSPIALLLIDAQRRQVQEANGKLEEQNDQLEGALAEKGKALARESSARLETVEEREKLRQSLVHRYVGDGSSLLDSGDWFGALVWFAEALRLDQGDPGREAMHRMRLGTILDRSPKLAQVWFPEKMTTATVFNSDGSRVIGLGQDGVVRVWAIGQEKPVLQFGKDIQKVAFNRDSSRLLAVHAGGKARLWDPAAGKPIHEFAHDRVSCATFCPDDAWAVTAGEDGSARTWLLANLQQPPRRTPRGSALRFAAIGPNGRLLITTSEQETIWWLWQAKKRTYLPIKNSTSKVESAVFSVPKGPVLTTHANAAHRPHAWELAAGSLTAKPPIERRVPGELDGCFLPTRGSLLTTEPGTGPGRSWVQTWDVAAGRLDGLRFPLPGYCIYAAYSPDGKRVFAAAANRVLRIWDAESGKPLTPPFVRRPALLLRARFSLDGRRLLLVTGAQETTHALEVLELPPAGYCEQGSQPWGNRPHTSPDGRHLLGVGIDQQSVRLWDTTTAKPVGPSLQYESPLKQVVFSADGRRALTADASSSHIWQIGGPESSFRRIQPTGLLKQAILTADGSRAVTLSRKENQYVVERWDAATGGTAGTPVEFQRPVSQMEALSPDGRLLVLARSVGANLDLVDTATGKSVLPTPLTHNARVTTVAFSPDSRRLVTACTDRTAHVWDTSVGKPVAALLPVGETVLGMAFRPDGRMLTTIHALPGNDKEGAAVRAWDAATWQPITPLFAHDKVQTATFGPDGRSLVSTAADNTVRVWDLKPTTRKPADLVELAELLACRRLNANGYLMPLEEVSLRNIWPKIRKHLADQKNPDR